MSNTSRFMIRSGIVGLLVAAAPVGSALGQQALETAPVTAPAGPTMIDALSQQANALLDQAQSEIRATEALEAEAAALRPGQFMWNPERSPSGEVEMVVSIADQKAYVYRANKLIGVTTVSTGMRGHRTPTGSFTILQKNRRHFSNLYNNAPMPNMQRLTWGGIALHAGALPGYPASHGCIRLPMEFSRELFGVTRMGGRVHIIAGAAPSAAGALAFATGGGRGAAMANAR